MIKKYDKGDSSRLSKNFRLAEFQCKCSRCSTVLVDEALVEILQAIRDHFGVAVDINSGYRCPEHNAEVPNSSPNSSHMQGMAADIWVEGIAPREVAKFAESMGVKRIGLYDSFVHIGSGTVKWFWLGHEGKTMDSFGGAPVKTFTLTMPVLKRGMEGATVQALQLLLQGHTDPRLMADGSFGPATQDEVMDYQQKMGLAVDGSVGPATWRSLLGV